VRRIPFEKLLLENLKGRHHFEDGSVAGKIY